MVRQGENRAWEESSEEESLEETSGDEESSEEGSVEGSTEGEEEGSEEGSSEEESESGQEDGEESSEEEDFEDEPNRNAGGENIVDIDKVPLDEENSEAEEGEDPDRKKRIAAVLCCCLIVLVIIAIVLGVTLGKDDGPAPTRPPTNMPSRAPSFMPSGMPSISASPTFAVPKEFNFIADADTYVFFRGDLDDQGFENEVGPFGDEESLLVQNRVNRTGTIALISFNISDLPDPEELVDLSSTATVHLTLETPLGFDTSIFSVRLPSRASNIEEYTSKLFGGLGTSEGLTWIDGPTFEILSGQAEVAFEISSLLFGQMPYVRRRRLRTQRTQLLLGLLCPIDDVEVEVRFLSSESSSPPVLRVLVQGPTDAPTISPAPSVSSAPSTTPTISNAPTLSPKPSTSTSPSALPSLSTTPSFTPSLSSAPTLLTSGEEATPCEICGEGQNVANPDGLVSVDFLEQNTTCSVLETEALGGGLTPVQCEALATAPVTAFPCCVEEESVGVRREV